jgi:predicted RNA binding protein YcfA (HicA-like mRNA interferase family)
MSKKLPRLNASEAEELLIKAGFVLKRIKGSHHIYSKGVVRATIPFHSGRILHPKIVKQVLSLIEENN